MVGTGFSPLQLVIGQNPTYPGLSETTPASTKAMKALKSIDEARVKFRKIDCDERLKKIRSQKINPAVERNYQMGDPIFFRDEKKKEWRPGTAMAQWNARLAFK